MANQATGESHPLFATAVRAQPAVRAECTVKKSAAELKGIDKLRQLNKKKMDAGRKKEEEEAKHKKDEEEALKKAEEERTKTTKQDDVAKKLHKIINSITEDKDDTNIVVDEDKEERSPAKKRGGSSKSSTKRVNRKPQQVSPQENQTQGEAATSILKTTEFKVTFIYPHRRIVMELAILYYKRLKCVGVVVGVCLP
jgi:hypothetical protein